MQRLLLVLILFTVLATGCNGNAPSSKPPAPAAPAASSGVTAPTAPEVAPPRPASPRPPAPPNAPPAPSKTAVPKPETTEKAVPPPVAVPAPEAPLAGAPSHQQWDELLRRHVSAAGKVDYAGLKKEKAALQQYLDLLAAQPVDDSWSRREKMAYWINAYNAFTVKLIVDNYPLAGIRDLHNGNPWDVAWIKLGGKTYSLNAIENDILRPRFQDARIHFAVNCAAKSCPPLLNRAFTAERLEQQLEQQARQFINNPAFNQLAGSKAAVSKIFEWYAKDFGNLSDFLNRYADTKLSPQAAISYLEYDWALNN